MLIFMQLLILMIYLALVGEPLRIIFSRNGGVFKDLDFIQIVTLDLFLGGFILYLIAIIPLQLFTVSAIWVALLLSLIFSVSYYALKFKKKRPELKVKDREAIIYQAATTVLFVVVLVMGVLPTNNFIFGNVHDSSLYSLFAKLIIDNHQVASTIYPFTNEGIIYPQGFFAVVATAKILPLDFSLAQIPLLITPLFQALTVFGAYYLGKALSDRKLGLSFAFILAIVSRWPRLLLWGSNGFVFGFPLYLVCLSLFIPLLFSWKWNKTIVYDLVAIGLLYGYLAAVHLTLYTALFFALLAGIVASLAYRHSILRAFRSSLSHIAIMLVISLAVISLFIFRALIWYHYPGHNIGLPIDVTIRPYPSFYPINWLLFSEGISPYPLLTFETLLLIGASISSLVYGWKSNCSKDTIKVILFSIAGTTAMFFAALLQYAFPALEIFIGEPARPTLLLFVSFCLLIGVWNVKLYQQLQSFFQERFSTIATKTRIRHGTAMILAVVALFSLIYAPYVYFEATSDEKYMNNQYSLFCATTQNDLNLMNWMSANLPINVSILINPYDAGSFIPIVANLKVVYPFTASRDSALYQNLVTLLDQKVMNQTTYKLINLLNLSHVFLGSRTALNNPSWDPQLFLGNPNFALSKNFGTSYLFEVTNNNSLNFLQDDFEYEKIEDGGWQFTSAEFKNNGTGDAQITSDYAAHENRSLLITAQKKQGWSYANWIYRSVYMSGGLPNVTLSFYMNSITSSPNDYLAVIVTDNSWVNAVYFASPNELTWGNMVKLRTPQGYFTVNLSQTWLERFNSTLPSTVNIEIQIADFDGIQDKGFVDFITLHGERSIA